MNTLEFNVSMNEGACKTSMGWLFFTYSMSIRRKKVIKIFVQIKLELVYDVIY